MRTPVVDTLSFAVTGTKQAEARNDALIYLETIRKSNEQPDLHIQTRLVEGDVAGAIVDTALSEQVDLIVMSTHGYSGLTRWVLGSVTEKVLRSAPCPVLAVRAARHPQKVLITLDGSPLSERAIEPGLAVAQSLNAAVTLLRVVPRVSTDGKLDEHERGLSRRMQEDLIEEAKDYLRGSIGSRSSIGCGDQIRSADRIARRYYSGTHRNVWHGFNRHGDSRSHRFETLGVWQRHRQGVTQCELFDARHSTDRR